MVNATKLIQTPTTARKSQVFQTDWVKICPIDSILPWSGVAALVDGYQIAIFRLDDEDRVYAISNYDPFSKAHVISRGLVGDRKGVIKVASPIYKQSFSLETGQCLDDPSISLPVWPARVVNATVQIAIVQIAIQ